MVANPSPLIVIVGQTASGKSDLALRLAEHFNGEIIAADTMTLRRGADIGSAKPSSGDQAKVRHHLIDIIEPDEAFSAAQFKALAEAAIKDIASRGRLPILVGGSGLYIDSLIFNYSFKPKSSAAERQELNQLSIDQLITLVKSADIGLTGVDVKNKRRLIRLIESGGAIDNRAELRANTLLIGLKLRKTELSRRITIRIDKMLAAGLLNEVVSLAEHYGWQSPVLQGVGYKQWQDYFLGTKNLDETRQQIIKATLDLAKKQATWFKRNKSIHWLSTPVKWANLVELTTTFLDSIVS